VREIEVERVSMGVKERERERQRRRNLKSNADCERGEINRKTGILTERKATNFILL